MQLHALTSAAGARALAFRMQDAGFADAPAGGASFALMLLQTLLALALVCGLAYALFRWVLPRLTAAGSANSMVRVVDRAGLDARKSLYVVEVAGRWLLVGASEAGVHLVSELDPERAREAAEELQGRRPTFGRDAAAVRGAFAERLEQLMGRKGGGK